VVGRGGALDSWDLKVRGGLFGAAKGMLAVEEHGAGKQLLRIRMRPRASWMFAGVAAVAALLAVGAYRDGAWTAGVALAGVALSIAALTLRDCGRAAARWMEAVERLQSEAKPRG